MPFLLFKFLHVGSMFLATALAVGPSVLLYRIARRGDNGAIQWAFPLVPTIFRAGAASYGLGILFGIVSALTGQLDLTAPWLLTAYLLVGVLIGFNLVFERWTRRVDAAATEVGSSTRLEAVVRERSPGVVLGGMIVTTIAIVFVMVVKPTVF